MKPDDLEFVREINRYMNRGNNPLFKNNIFVAFEVHRLINLLIESEAMREKTEFEKGHHCMRRLIAANDKITFDPPRDEPCIDERHYRSDEQWIAAKRKEIEGE